VHLDHQVFEEGGALHYRWYVPAAVARKGEIRTVFAAYETELAQRARALAGRTTEPRRAPTDEPFPLTNLQTAYAFGRLAGAHPSGCALHLEYELDAVDTAGLERAWRDVVTHHPMLRAGVLSSGQQRIHAGPLALEQVTATDRDDFEQRCQAIRNAMLGRVAPLDSYPYATAALCALPGDRARLFLHVDLVVADARSAMLVASQWLARYRDPSAPLEVAGGSFRDYVAHRLAQRTGAVAAEHRAYWERKLAALPAGPRLAITDRPPHRERHQLVRALPCAAALEDRARRLGVPLDTVLLAAYGQTLVAWNGAPCTVVAVSWDREPVFAGIDALVGDFTQLSWVAFDAEPDADAAIRRTQRQLDDDAAHRAIDGLELLRARPDLAFPAVYTAMIAGPTPAHAISQTPGVVVDSITWITGDALAVHWDSIAADRITEGDMFDRYCATLEAWAAPRAAAAGDPAGDPIDLPASGVLLHELIERADIAHGERCAVKYGDIVISYRELERRTRRVASWLLARGVRPDDVVAVYMHRSVEMVVALMAILRAGAAYMPLDVAAPPARTLQIAGSSRTRFALTQRAMRAVWEGAPGVDVLCLDDELDAPADQLLDGPLGAAGERNLAYVIYTSGSTGAPKGCMIEHHSIVNRIAWMQHQFGLRAGDVVLQKTPYSFDVSVWEFFWPLAVGAAIVVARPGGHLDASYLLELIERERVTICHFVPSMLRVMLAEPGVERMAGLARVVVSGEALDYDLMESFLDRVGIPLDNLYGPTEAAVDVSHWPCRRNAERRTTIGRAITGVQLYVLDEALEPVACGEIGELYIGGIAVGRGYLGDPELTGSSFIEAPFGAPGRLYKTGDLAAITPEGDILYLGRRDGQVKLNGLRIELAEIEHHLRCHPDIEDALVTKEGAADKALLVAYLVPRGEAMPPRDVLRGFLRDRVPEYMVPHAFVRIAAIPLTAHGKRKRGGPVSARPWTKDQLGGRSLVELLREIPG
jgi:amino acid adenylation domain-containing protein